MKKYIAFMTVCLFVFDLISAQSNKILKTEYSIDSVPSLITFNINTTNFRRSDGINVIKEYLKLSNDDSFISKKSFTDESGFFHERFQHYYKGLKVEFSEYDVHSNKGQITSISGTLKRIKFLNVKPILTEKEALSFALKNSKAERYMWENSEMEELLKKEKNDSSATFYPKGDLVIWTDWNSAKVILTYKFKIFSQIPLEHNYVYIDALNGNVIDKQSLLVEAIGTAATKYCGIQNITTYDNGNYFELYDATRNIETLDMNSCTNYGSAYEFLDEDNYWSYYEFHNATMDDAALNAHYAAEKTYDYFNQPFIGRQGWDGNNSLLKLYVHYYINWPNAAWDYDYDCIQMGDGDGGVNYDPWTDLDATAHEYAHGIKDYEVGQNYNGEPGAIEEGLSDIWAACVENYASLTNHDPWTMYDGFEKNGHHRRNLANPNSNQYHYHIGPYQQEEYRYPDVYHGQYWYTGPLNTYFVHCNSTVFSHWFYLLSQGGYGTNSEQTSYCVSPIGMTDAAKIVYYMETAYLTENSTFTNVRTFTIAAAEHFWGHNSNQVVQTTNAWYAVGVGAQFQNFLYGSNTLCSSGLAYIVNTLSTGDSITWHCSENISRLSSQGSNPCYFHANGSGTGWIEATINLACGGNYTLRKDPIQVNPSINFISTNYLQDCNSVTLTADIPPYTTVTWNASSNFLIDGYFTPYTKQGNSITVTSYDGMGGTVYGTTDIGCNINEFSTFCPCQPWDGASITWIWACPIPGEPLEAEVSPLHPDATEYKWYIGDELIETTYDGYLQTYNWHCTSEMPPVYVYGVTSCGQTVGIYGGEFFPACGGYKMTSNVILYPNPASNQITIELAEIPIIDIQTKNNSSSIYLSDITQIKIIDKMGLTKKVMNFSKGNRVIVLNLFELRSDLYFLDITDGIKKVRVSFIISR